MNALYIVLLTLAGLYVYTAEAKAPNIVLIVADDYGYNDIGYHGSEISTPNLDKLAAEGVKLENYYVQPICSPSRSQLMTGRYQIHTGLQNGVILLCEPYGLPLKDKTLADKLKEVGYKTHIVGKWHLGYYEKAYYPTRRGFDSFYGIVNGAADYYTHYRQITFNNGYGLDFWDNETPDNSSYNEYSTDLFTRRAEKIISEHDKSDPLFLYLPYQAPHYPLQVPQVYEDMYKNISDNNRRIYAGMVTAMDDSILQVTESLKANDLWDNTLIVFTNDNGGETNFGGSNFPLRGGKSDYFEGGVRGVGFVSGPVIKTGGVVNHQMIHVSDWFPTLINLAGGSLSDTKPDGYDVWRSITENTTSPRKEILFNIETNVRRRGKTTSKVFDTSVKAALRYGDYKILTGNHRSSPWLPKPASTPNYTEFVKMKRKETKKSNTNVQVFNIAKDPEERVDLSQRRPDLVKLLLKRLAKWNTSAVPAIDKRRDPKCTPKLTGGVWAPWRFTNKDVLG